MENRSGLQKLLDFSSLLAVGCALVAVVVLLKKEPADMLPRAESREIPGWETLASVGHRTGAQDPALTILVFSDYECPACRRLHSELEEFTRDHPDDVAVVIRHFPLGQHRYAYEAARAAECAGGQGRFHQFHSALFEEEMWLGGAFQRFASEVGVRDLDAFRTCTSTTDSVPSISADLRAAEALNLYGTPAIIINGFLVYRLPDPAVLEEMISFARSESDFEPARFLGDGGKE